MNKHIIYSVSLFALYVFFVLQFIACKGPAYSIITESDVQAIMKEVGIANLNKDIIAIEKHMAPFVVINIEMETPAGLSRIQMSRDQYISELKKVFSGTTQYDYKQENTIIRIRDDGKTATVETDVFEHIVLNGIEGRTITHEIAVLEIVNGHIVVTILDASIKKI